MLYTIFDIEADGLIDSVTKIHCLSFSTFDSSNNNDLVKSGTLTTKEEMIDFLKKETVLVGHNIIRYDLPVMKKILGVSTKAKLYDTLGFSWYLCPKRESHGLESWGTSLGIPKPVIEDWNNLSIEEYINRCETDVRINTQLFFLQLNYFFALYSTPEKVKRVMGYLSYKLDCAREQEEKKLKLDVEQCKKNLALLEEEKEKRVKILSEIMPPKVEYKVFSRPKVMYKKDKTLSEHGKKWLEKLNSLGLPHHHKTAVKIPSKTTLGNPNSHPQVKEWLFSLGWVPDVYKYEKEEDGSLRKIPQISEHGELTQSVKNLLDVVPGLSHLSGYYVVNHRIGILKGFLEKMDENGYIQSQIEGFTNTLRMQHRKPFANLPAYNKPYGQYIRSCIIADNENEILCGADMTALEDSTKQHYIYFYDPEYVQQMRVPGFDPHIDIGVLANMLTREDEEFFKWAEKQEELSQDENAKLGKIKNIRKKAKVVNFASVYGAGPAKIALTGGFTLKEAQTLHTIYWKRNKAVKQVANACKIKKVSGQMWLYNPVSGFWCSLRAEKDKFSTLNQSTGVYCFDSWIRQVRNRGVKISMQYHDEIAFSLPKSEIEDCRKVLLEAIEVTNEELKLNIPLSISVAFGERYSDIH